MNPQETLYQLIRSRHPVIVVQSHETRRVLESIVELVDIDYRRVASQGKPRRKLYVWSVVRGLYEIGTQVSNLYEEIQVQVGDNDYEPMPDPIAESVGIFVAEVKQEKIDRDRQRVLGEALRDAAGLAVQLGIEQDEAVRIFRRHLAEFQDKKGNKS